MKPPDEDCQTFSSGLCLLTPYNQLAPSALGAPWELMTPGWLALAADDPRLALGRGHGLLFSPGGVGVSEAQKKVNLSPQQAWLAPEPRAPP